MFSNWAPSYYYLYNTELLVAPDRVEIRGPTTAKVGQTLNFDCITSNSNPASTLLWQVDGKTQTAGWNKTDISSEGGWATRSNITVTISPDDKSKTISCYAKNSALGETKVETHIVTVLCKYKHISIDIRYSYSCFFLLFSCNIWCKYVSGRMIHKYYK